MEYELIKWLHILSSIILFGTGLGSAFYKWQADRKGNLEVILYTNRTVVLADWIFTTPTVIIQPLTGVMLINAIGYSFTEPWLLITYILYTIAGGCWLPVVWLQIRMRNIAQQAVKADSLLEDTYFRLANYWFWLGVPAFVSMMTIVFLMVFKPDINL